MVFSLFAEPADLGDTEGAVVGTNFPDHGNSRRLSRLENLGAMGQEFAERQKAVPANGRLPAQRFFSVRRQKLKTSGREPDWFLMSDTESLTVEGACQRGWPTPSWIE